VRREPERARRKGAGPERRTATLMTEKQSFKTEAITYLTYADVNDGRASTLENFRGYLARFARDQTIMFCIYSNSCLFGPDLGWNWFRHDALVRRYLLPLLLTTPSRAQPGRIPILHRHLFLFLIKEATVRCPVIGLDPWTERNDLTTLILMANDHLGFPQAQRIPGENNLALLATLVVAGETSRLPAWRHKMVRTALILKYVLEKDSALLAEFDLFGQFERAVGLPLNTYISMIFALATKHLGDQPTPDQLPASYSIGRNWFRDTIVPPEQATAFFRDVSATIDELAVMIGSTPTHLSDFRAFIAKPLLQIGDSYYAVDFDFLASKADNGIFWKVVSSLPTKREQDKFIAFWGKVFEHYANWLFERFATSAEINRVLIDPRYADDETNQACDAIIVSGTVACFLEYKGSVFKADSKYTGDPSRPLRKGF